MTSGENSSVLLTKPAVVGTVHSPGSLRAALRLRAGALDFVELRVDAFADDPAPLLRAAPRLKVPCLLTVRHPAEGGVNGLSTARRRALYAEFLPHAALIDIELRSVEKLADVIAAARKLGVKIIVSAHDFRRTPSPAQLQARIRSAQHAGADICKLATLTSTAADLQRLLALFTRRQPLPLSVMGMGAFGKVSRLLLARAGSVLNYGYLDRPNASGQWEARVLRERVRELGEG